MHARVIPSIAGALLLVSATAARAQYYQSDFPADEFREPACQGVRADRRGCSSSRPGHAADGRLHAPAPAQHLLLLVWHRNPRRVPAAGRTQQKGHDLPARAQPAARSRGRSRAVGGGCGSRQADLRRQ